MKTATAINIPREQYTLNTQRLLPYKACIQFILVEKSRQKNIMSMITGKFNQLKLWRFKRKYATAIKGTIKKGYKVLIPDMGKILL